MDGPRENSVPKWAERLFVQEGRTLAEISSRHQVDLTTLLRWQKEGEWDRKRSALLANPEILAERLRLALGKMLDALENGEDLDPKAFNSIARAYGRQKPGPGRLRLKGGGPQGDGGLHQIFEGATGGPGGIAAHRGEDQGLV